jgi:hypothetical protein
VKTLTGHDRAGEDLFPQLAINLFAFDFRNFVHD